MAALSGQCVGLPQACLSVMAAALPRSHTLVGVTAEWICSVCLLTESRRKSLGRRKKQITNALTSELLKIIGMDVESLKDFNSKVVLLFSKCLSPTNITKNSNGNDIFLGIVYIK